MIMNHLDASFGLHVSVCVCVPSALNKMLDRVLGVGGCVCEREREEYMSERKGVICVCVYIYRYTFDLLM